VLSAAAVVFTPSPTVPSQFQLGTPGRNNCPARYDRITALSVCETAAAFLGMPFGGSEWNHEYPNGCYMVGSVYLNTYGFGGNVEASSYQLLCASGAPHARACMCACAFLDFCAACAPDVTVSGAEETNSGSMGVYMSAAMTQGGRPVYKRVGTTVQYLFYSPEVKRWRISPDYMDAVVNISTGYTAALCPEQATGYASWTGSEWASTPVITVLAKIARGTYHLSHTRTHAQSQFTSHVPQVKCGRKGRPTRTGLPELATPR
jgi:hypothetical protein